MTNPTRIEVNCATGEVTEHELTAEEIEQRELDAIASATEQAEREAAVLIVYRRSSSISTTTRSVRCRVGTRR